MLVLLRPEAEQELLEVQAWYESKALGLGFEFARAANAGESISFVKFCMLLTLLLVWGLPVLVGLGFCSLVWSFTKALDFRVAAVIRALAVSGTFSPGYGAGYGLIPVPASMFLFFTPSDSTFLEQAKASIPPILVIWFCLIPVFLYVGYANKNRMSDRGDR